MNFCPLLLNGEKLTPYDGITLYESKEVAKKDYPIIDFEKTEVYKRHIKMFGK